MYKKMCTVCGDVFEATSSRTRLCFSCRELRARYCGQQPSKKGLAKISLNMAAIERDNVAAQKEGLSYGKSVGKRYAARHVQVSAPTTGDKKQQKGEENHEQIERGRRVSCGQATRGE